MPAIPSTGGNDAYAPLQKTKVLADGTAGPPQPLDIQDIRRAAVETNLRQDVLDQFCPKDGPRTLPTLLLYDETGLQLFEKITYLDEYYLTKNEADLLCEHASAIASHIPQGAILVELGSGNLRKVYFLLQALEQAGTTVDYYALDLSRAELARTLAQLPPHLHHVRCHGLLGTYDDGRAWLQTPAVQQRPKYILTLGSSIGNFQRPAAAAFLRDFADVLQHPEDAVLVGLDSCADPARVYDAYNDKRGLTHKFVLNGLVHANRLLHTPSKPDDPDTFHMPDWRVHGEYVHDEDGSRHQAFYVPCRPTVVLGQCVQPHERIMVEQSFKLSPAEAQQLWQEAGLAEKCLWQNQSKEHGLYLLKKTKMPFSLRPAAYARSVLPSIVDWEAAWAAWDTVTRRMLPREELLEKPIKLRNACIFYLGHIPAFLDIQINKTVPGACPTAPASYADIFERGIDPDVDNPALCHDHSAIPDSWPPLADILAYQQRVRARLRAIYAAHPMPTPSSHAPMSRTVAQAIWVGFEHELMHLETLLYMLLQSDRTLPPPPDVAARPDFAHMAAEARAMRGPNTWFDVPAQTVVLGMDDPDGSTDPTRHFGWDNEKPTRTVQVHAFQAQGRPITNKEYAAYMYYAGIDKIPASWTSQQAANGLNGHTDGLTDDTNRHSNEHADDECPSSFLADKAVRTVYGPVSLALALDWPVCASYNELLACAAWLGGRIPTLEEVRSIYQHADPTPTQPNLFRDLSNANVGLQNWHPTAVTASSGRLGGQGAMGGVWEWASTPLALHAGFVPMALYPGYTADFFDGKHNVVLGGSWATHPRLAGRKSFINWYQRNYPYAWVGARLVRDV